MKNKFNPQLLKEELNRFKLLETYDFYSGDNNFFVPVKEADETPDDLKPTDDADAAASAIGDELGIDTGETSGEVDDSLPTEEPMDDMTMDTEEPADDSTEVDVTALVKGSEEAKTAADNAMNATNQNTQALMQKLDSLEARVANMDKIGTKIEALEKEIINRNPTPIEKLEMRSFDSYPYSQKLTDFWKDKEGAYNVMGTQEPKKKEYVLTKDDVDAGYSDSDIKKSFAVKPDYEEEDVDGYEEENI